MTADQRYREFLAECVREAERGHSPEQWAAADAHLSTPKRSVQPQLELEARPA